MELLQVLIFLAVSLGVMAGAFIWTEVARRDQLRAVKRLSEELARDQPESASPSLFKSLDELEPTVQPPSDPATPPPLTPFDGETPAPPPTEGPRAPLAARWRGQLRPLLEHAGLRLSPRGFLAVCGGVAAVLFVVGWLILGALLAIPASLAGAAAPWLYLRMRLNARREKLLRQMPTAFDLMARVLRSGLSMPQAFQGVAEALENPIAAEFARCRDEQNLGVLPEVSFRAMAERTGVLEMKIFVMSMLIQRQTGGNLSEVLERLATLIRERLRLRSLVRTLTAEGRLQAIVLLILPVVMFTAMRCINRPYTDVLLAHPEWLGATAALMAVGALWIRKVIDIE